MNNALLNTAAILAGGLLPTNPTPDQMRKAAQQAVELARMIIDTEFDSRQSHRDQLVTDLIER